MFRAILSLALGMLLLAACGAPPPGTLSPIDDGLTPLPPDASTVCQADAVWATPRDGDTLVHRTRNLVLHHPAGAEVDVAVFGPKGALRGDLWVAADQSLFQPWQPWPADSRITWVADICGERHAGSFTTGAVLRPLNDQELKDTYVEVPYSLDLRVADWTAPVPVGAAANDDKATVRTGLRFGVSLLAMVTDFDDDTLSLRLAPAIPEMNGIYAQDLCRATYDVTLPRGDGAYLWFAMAAVEATAKDQPVVMRELSVVLGLGRDGFDDGFMAGELDLRDYETDDGRDGCRLFGELTGHACEPCSADQVDACAPFEVRGIRGLVTDEAPERMGERR